MRKSFLLPLKFLLFFLISAVVFSLFVLIFSWGENFSRAAGSVNSLMLFFSAAAGKIMFPSVSSALLFTAFDYRKKKLGIIASLLLAVSVFVVLFFGLKFSTALEEPADSRSFQPFQSEKIHAVEGGLIYTEKTSSESSVGIEGIIIRKHGSSLPGFEYFDEGQFQQLPEPVLSAEGSTVLKINPRNPVYQQIFNPPELLGGYLSDIDFCNKMFLSAAEKGGMDFLLLTAAFTAFLVICLLFKGITVWPLFEMMLILFFHRIVFYILNLFTGEADFISETFFGGNPISSIPLYTILAMSILLLLSGLLIRTSTRLRKK
jgi:hypothetical protein